ncbi:MAG: hypothetical protein JST86_10440 [Bacteroidetes bacterium]|nr:hypothetical protein [Bacteroidota bacterium]
MTPLKRNKRKDLGIKILDFVSMYAAGIASYLLKAGFQNVEVADSNGYGKATFHAPDYACQLILFHANIELSEDTISGQIIQLKSDYPNAWIVVYSTKYSSHLLSEIFAKDINGYFLLSEKPNNLIKVIDEVREDMLSLSEDVVNYYKYKRKMKTLIKTLNTAVESTKVPPVQAPENIKRNSTRELQD